MEKLKLRFLSLISSADHNKRIVSTKSEPAVSSRGFNGSDSESAKMKSSGKLPLENTFIWDNNM